MSSTSNSCRLDWVFRDQTKEIRARRQTWLDTQLRRQMSALRHATLGIGRNFHRPVRTIVPKVPNLNYLVADANGNHLAGIADSQIAHAFADYLNSL